MKNLTRKLLVALLAVFMVFANATTVKAVGANDQGKITVKGLQEGEKVHFYQIVDVTYAGSGTDIAENWAYASNDATLKAEVLDMLKKAKENNIAGIKFEEFINKYAEMLKNKTLTPVAEKTVPAAKVGEKYEAVWEKTDAEAGPEAGIYIAVVENAQNARIYNPALLTVMYDGETLIEGLVDLGDKYTNSATLKSSNPGGDKAVKDGVVYDESEKQHKEDEDNAWETKPNDAEEKSGVKTVGLGDKVDYEAYIDIPEYPLNAKNKTLWFGDTMCQGLSFDSKYFKLSLVKDVKTQSDKVETTLADTSDATVKDIKVGDVVIGHIKFTEGEGGKFQAYMEYENLRGVLVPDHAEAISDYHIRLDYAAIVNEKAAVGHTGNKNKLEYAWSNDPLKGTTYTGWDRPSGEGIDSDEDEEIVYTYEISVLKVDEKVEELFNEDGSIKSAKELYEEYYNDVKHGEVVVTDYDELTDEEKANFAKRVFLAGAEFDVLDADDNKVAHVVTNGNGVATVSVVSAGTYTFKETKAPAGYAFDPTNSSKEVEAKWTTCTYTNSVSERKVRYTSEKSKAADPKQVGWLVGEGDNADFYEMGALDYTYDEENDKVLDAKGNEVAGVFPAYILSVEANSSSSSTTITNTAADPAGVAVLQFNNSKTAVLPSTGGIGTYIFTIAGVAILATAAFMLIFRKREEA